MGQRTFELAHDQTTYPRHQEIIAVINRAFHWRASGTLGLTGSVRGHRRTQAIRGWPGPSVDGLVSVYGLAIAGHPRMAWPSPLKPKLSE